jgi:hypothetical protein
MEPPACVEVVNDHRDQEHVDDHHRTDDAGYCAVRRLSDESSHGRNYHADRGEHHVALVSLGTLSVQEPQGREQSKQADAGEWKDQKDVRIGERVCRRRRVNAPLAVDRHPESYCNGRCADRHARKAEQLVNVAPAVGDQSCLHDQQQDPGSRQRAMNVDDRRDRRLRTVVESGEIVGPREAGEGDGRHRNGHPTEESPVAEWSYLCRDADHCWLPYAYRPAHCRATRTLADAA